ncbi:uncharacterized protein LOC119442748 isoform X2 [Dermacentor silvarum]|uniref:uncharacterized protein LOC119442748 isoform X2 n=1 Tax=Dermacentor silvarum TaxID=543639 RepID=UPI002100D6CB|nr:uncharacterized protein LOC119442748 isoform X2 [Dermacentor silvarum]
MEEGERERVVVESRVAGVAAAHYNVLSDHLCSARAKAHGCCGSNAGSRRLARRRQQQLTSRREVHIDRGGHVTAGVCTPVCMCVCRQPGPHDGGLSVSARSPDAAVGLLARSLVGTRDARSVDRGRLCTWQERKTETFPPAAAVCIKALCSEQCLRPCTAAAKEAR